VAPLVGRDPHPHAPTRCSVEAWAAQRDRELLHVHDRCGLRLHTRAATLGLSAGVIGITLGTGARRRAIGAVVAPGSSSLRVGPTTCAGLPALRRAVRACCRWPRARRGSRPGSSASLSSPRESG
jgi:hypothetical protein